MVEKGTGERDLHKEDEETEARLRKGITRHGGRRDKGARLRKGITRRGGRRNRGETEERNKGK